MCWVQRGLLCCCFWLSGLGFPLPLWFFLFLCSFSRFIYSKGSGRGRDRDRELFQPLVHFPNDTNNHIWASQKPGPWTCTGVLHVEIFGCLPRRISRMLGQKWGLDLNRHLLWDAGFTESGLLLPVFHANLSTTVYCLCFTMLFNNHHKY